MARAAHCCLRDPDLDAGSEYISEAEVRVEKLLSEVSVWSGLKKENLNGLM